MMNCITRQQNIISILPNERPCFVLVFYSITALHNSVSNEKQLSVLFFGELVFLKSLILERWGGGGGRGSEGKVGHFLFV